MNKILWIIPALLLSGMAIAQPEMEVVDEILAVVGDEIILRSDFEAEKVNFERGGMAVNSELEGFLLEQMMLQKLMVHMAKVDSIEVTDQEVENDLNERMSYYLSQIGSEEAFEEFYGKSARAFKEELTEPVKDQLLVRKYQQTIMQSVRVTPEDVKQFYESIPKDSLPLIDTEVQYSHIVVTPGVRQQAKDKVIHFLDSIRQDLIDGKTTMLVQAARHSEDPGSKFKGGCYELIRRGSFDPAYEAAVYNTPEGQYSQVFESVFGYHFVQVKEKRGELFTSCHILKRPEVNPEDLQKARIKLDSIAVAIQLDSINFAKAAMKFSTDEETGKQGGKIFDPRSKATRFQLNQLDPSVFFVLDGLEPGDISESMEYEMPDGSKGWRIVRLDSRSSPHKANLREDYQLLQGMATEQAQDEAMEDWVKKYASNTYVRIHPAFAEKSFSYDWPQE